MRDVKKEIKTNSTGKKTRDSLGSALETYTSKNLWNLEEIQILDTYGLPTLSQEDLNHLNRCTTIGELGSN